MATIDLPTQALAALPNGSDDRRIRLYASEASVLELFLLFSAFSAFEKQISFLREGQEVEEWNFGSEPSLVRAFEHFYDVSTRRDLNALVVSDLRRNFVYFDWDDRYFIAGGSQDFLARCHPMPIEVGRMHFDAMILNSPDKEHLLALWTSLAHMM